MSRDRVDIIYVGVSWCGVSWSGPAIAGPDMFVDQRRCKLTVRSIFLIKICFTIGYGNSRVKAVATHTKLRAVPSHTVMNDKYQVSTNSLDESERRLNHETQPPANRLSSRSEAEIELWKALCFTEAQTYPWRPLTRESQTYFTELEVSSSSLINRPSEEVAAGAQRFLAHMDRLWDAATPEMMANGMEGQFAQVIPASLLQVMGDQVKQLKKSPLTLAEQLVQCTYEVMPQWAVEDLQVLARPFAYAMRGTEADSAIETILDKATGSNWTDLSEIEQVRLCLAYARYTLADRD